MATVWPDKHVEVGRTSYSLASHLVMLGIACAAVAVVEGGRRQLRLDKLTRESERNQARAEAGALAIMRTIFFELTDLCERAEHYSNERVSLFRCDGDFFALIGRRSRSPVRERTAGRERYPLNEGCLGRAWRDGRAEERGLPASGDEPPWNPAWISGQEAWGLPRATAAALEMPSRSYLAFRIETPARPLGVLVFESVNSVRDAEQADSPATLSFDPLDRLQRRAAGRLAILLSESAFVEVQDVSRLRPVLFD